MSTDVQRYTKCNGRQIWIWQQDGARAHTARASVQFLQQSTPDFIEPEDWLFKSPDLNVMDYCIWGLLLTELQNCRRDIKSIDYIPQVTFKNATQAWVSRLRQCSESARTAF